MTISSASLANLKHEGRAPAFTETEALKLLRAKMECGATTLPEFMRNMQESGELKKDVSRPTMQRLFSGQLMPGLIDPRTGKVFDYAALPKPKWGRPSRFNEDGIDPVTKERRRGTPPLRQWLLDKTLEEMRLILDRRVMYHYTVFRTDQNKENAALRAELKELRGRLDGLTNKAK